LRELSDLYRRVEKMASADVAMTSVAGVLLNLDEVLTN
jgi:hypothetical protein